MSCDLLPAEVVQGLVNTRKIKEDPNAARRSSLLCLVAAEFHGSHPSGERLMVKWLGTFYTPNILCAYRLSVRDTSRALTRHFLTFLQCFLCLSPALLGDVKLPMQRKANWPNLQRDLNSNMPHKASAHKMLILKILFLTPGYFYRSDAATFLLSVVGRKCCFCCWKHLCLHWRRGHTSVRKPPARLFF